MKKQKISNLEKIPIAIIYKQGWQITIDFTRDNKNTAFELYGFLIIWLERLKQEIIQSFEKTEK